MNTVVLLIAFPLVMGVLMVLGSRKQRKAMQATIDLHESLQPGDRVHTTSGLEATVVSFTDDTVDLEIAPGIVTTWMKLAVRDRILPDDDDDDEDYEPESTALELDEAESADSDTSRVIKDS